MKKVEMLRHVLQQNSVIEPIKCSSVGKGVLTGNMMRSESQLTDAIAIAKGVTLVISIEIPDPPEKPYAYWPGGEDPAQGNLVDVIFRNGDKINGYESDCFRWDHKKDFRDVIAWRVSEIQSKD